MMEIQIQYMTNRLRLAAGLIIAGLMVQLASLFWRYPLSFIALVLAGSMLSSWGTVIYLSGIVRHAKAGGDGDDRAPGPAVCARQRV